MITVCPLLSFGFFAVSRGVDLIVGNRFLVSRAGAG
jgi:hypothetical protein